MNFMFKKSLACCAVFLVILFSQAPVVAGEAIYPEGDVAIDNFKPDTSMSFFGIPELLDETELIQDSNSPIMEESVFGQTTSLGVLLKKNEADIVGAESDDLSFAGVRFAFTSVKNLFAQFVIDVNYKEEDNFDVYDFETRTKVGFSFPLGRKSMALTVYGGAGLDFQGFYFQESSANFYFYIPYGTVGGRFDIKIGKVFSIGLDFGVEIPFTGKFKIEDASGNEAEADIELDGVGFRVEVPLNLHISKAMAFNVTGGFSQLKAETESGGEIESEEFYAILGFRFTH